MYVRIAHKGRIAARQAKVGLSKLNTTGGYGLHFQDVDTTGGDRVVQQQPSLHGGDEAPVLENLYNDVSGDEVVQQPPHQSGDETPVLENLSDDTSGDEVDDEVSQVEPREFIQEPPIEDDNVVESPPAAAIIDVYC